MTLTNKARLYRKYIEKAVQGLNEQDSSIVPELFCQMSYSNELISAGTKINWNGTLKQSLVDLWDVVDYNPDNAPTLWIDISYKDGYRLIPDIITSSEAFSLGEIGWWKDNLYKSLIDSNVYTPDQYMSGWELIQEV